MLWNILQKLDQDRDPALARLRELLSIPSISTDSAYAGSCRDAARWLGEQLRACGLEVEVHPTQRHPIVFGRSTAAGEGAATVLFYGHYDVQPPDPLEQWTTPPFEPDIRDGRLYARGASDDKGQVMCFVEALRAWKETTGAPPPVNLKVLIEGEEESGSTSLDAFIEEHAGELEADVAVVSDTAMWDYATPAITYALRGLLYFDLRLRGPSRDLHSGVYGGTLANPATELAGVLGQLFDDRHRVAIPGFYDDVAPISREERKRWDALGFDERRYAQSIGLDALHGEAGRDTLERRWARPSCDVNGLWGGYMGEGAKTVIPSVAGAKVSFRLAADQRPERIEQAFREWLEARTPPGCRWEMDQLGAAPPVIMPLDSPYLRAAERAVETGCGQSPMLIREGATIPVVSTFKTRLGLDTLLIGFGLNDDNLHSPNEKFELEHFEMGRRTHAALLERLSS